MNTPNMPEKNNNQVGRIVRRPSAEGQNTQPVQPVQPAQPLKSMNDSRTIQLPKGQSKTNGNVGARMNIKDQTVSKRRSAKEAKKIDPDSPEIKRSAKRAQEYKIKKKKKGISRLAIAYALVFLLVFSALCGIVALAFRSSLTETDPPAYEGLKLKMCLSHQVKEVKSISVDTTKYVRNGQLYVNMTALSETFGFIMTGDHKNIRFITNEDTAESVRFVVDSPFAEINGTVVRLSGATFSSSGSLFVPVDFFGEYVKGITVTLTEERDRPLLTVSRDTARNEAGHFDELEVEFTLKRTDTCQSIDEFTLPQSIKDKCTFITVIPEVPSGTDQN